MISYAQNFEDVILWRALKHIERGFYIDIGAQDPVIDSVSLAFYERGWRGLHVEPTPQYAEKLRAARPDEKVVEAAIGESDEPLQLFEIADTGLSTGNREIAQSHIAKGFSANSIEVACMPLAHLLDTCGDHSIHWLKMDVEGMEHQVIASWAPSPVRPWIVVVESTRPTSPEPAFVSWEPQLLALGYEFVYFDGLNRFYVNTDHQELKESFGPGPNVFDEFALSGLASAPFCRKVNAERITLQQQLAERTDETTRLSQALDTARTEAASQTAAFAQAAAAWERASVTLTGEISLKSETIAALRAELGQNARDKEVEKKAAEQEIANLTDALTQNTSQLQAIHASRLWRVTRLLRRER